MYELLSYPNYPQPNPTCFLLNEEWKEEDAEFEERQMLVIRNIRVTITTSNLIICTRVRDFDSTLITYTTQNRNHIEPQRKAACQVET